VRRQQRPRYGFYVTISSTYSVPCADDGAWRKRLPPLADGDGDARCLYAALGESYLATYTLGCFELSQGFFGPTEIRILLVAGNLALLRSPYSTLFGHSFLLFDVGGAIAAVSMFATAIIVAMRAHGRALRQEPLP